MCKLILIVTCLICWTNAEAENISVASWNIAANFHSINSGIERNIAEGIKLIDADIIGLSEVRSRDSLQRIANILENDHNLEYDMKFCEETANLHLGFLVKTRLNSGLGVQVTGSDLNSTRHRQACVTAVTAGEFDFIAIVVHLKSARSGRATRVEQSNALAAFVRGVTYFGERDVLLIGDYNMFPSRDNDAFAALSPTNFLRFLTTEELCDPNGLNCEGTHIARGRVRNMLDGFAISRNFTTEYVAGSFDRIDLHTLMNKSLSSFVASDVADHLPIRAEFTISGPDDDG